MNELAEKSPEEIEILAAGIAAGALFTGVHIQFDKRYGETKSALFSCFLPLATFSQNDWAQLQLAQWVPYQWVKEAAVQLSKKPPLYEFHTFQFMSIDDALAAVRRARALGWAGLGH